MGYYSTISAISYETDLTFEEFQKEKEAFRKEVEERLKNESLYNLYDRDATLFYLDSYLQGLVCVPRDNGGIVEWRSERTDKFYKNELLAEFVSRTIKPGHEIEIYFEGEDGEVWGWRISKGKAIPMVRISAFVPADEVSKYKIIKEE